MNADAKLELRRLRDCGTVLYPARWSPVPREVLALQLLVRLRMADTSRMVIDGVERTVGQLTDYGRAHCALEMR